MTSPGAVSKSTAPKRVPASIYRPAACAWLKVESRLHVEVLAQSFQSCQAPGQFLPSALRESSREYFPSLLSFYFLYVSVRFLQTTRRRRPCCDTERRDMQSKWKVEPSFQPFLVVFPAKLVSCFCISFFFGISLKRPTAALGVFE